MTVQRLIEITHLDEAALIRQGLVIRRRGELVPSSSGEKLIDDVIKLIDKRNKGKAEALTIILGEKDERKLRECGLTRFSQLFHDDSDELKTVTNEGLHLLDFLALTGNQSVDWIKFWIEQENKRFKMRYVVESFNYTGGYDEEREENEYVYEVEKSSSCLGEIMQYLKEKGLTPVPVSNPYAVGRWELHDVNGNTNYSMHVEWFNNNEEKFKEWEEYCVHKSHKS